MDTFKDMNADQGLRMVLKAGKIRDVANFVAIKASQIWNFSATSRCVARILNHEIDDTIECSNRPQINGIDCGILSFGPLNDL